MIAFLYHRVSLKEVLLCSTLATIIWAFSAISLSKTEEHENKLEASIAFAEHDVAMMKDPSLGFVPSDRILQAKEYRDNLIATDNFTPLSSLNWKSLGPKNQGGRTRSILIDANDATGNKMFAASVSGGLWKCTNALSANPTWSAVNNFLDNLAITSMVQHPSQPQIMYLCTGESGYSNIDALRGLGVFKSIDGGETWSQLPATNNSNFYQCFKLAINSQGHLFVATTEGLHRSADAGVSFTKVLGANMGITNTVSNDCFDVDVAPNGTIVSTLRGSIHRSTDNGATFQNGMSLPIFAGRIELDISKTNSSVFYALVELNFKVFGILKTTNGGITWQTRPEPDDLDYEIPNTDFSRLQAWYDLAITVDPNDDDIVYVGGINLFKSTDGASNWEQISHWYGGFGKQYVHADQHMILFHPTAPNTFFVANDGGIFRSTSAQLTTPTFKDISNNYITTQFYTCAMSPTANKNYFLAGSQDNGTHVFSKGVLQSTVQVTGGDGMFCHIDANEPNIQFSSFQYANYNRSIDGGNHWETISTSGGNFLNVTDYDDVNKVMFTADNTGTFKRWDNASSGSNFTRFNLPVDNYHNMVSAITVSPNQTNTVYFGMDDGKLVKATNANANNPIFQNIGTGLPSGYISCVAVQPGNENKIIVTLSNYGVNSIWITNNGGSNWQSIEGNLPDMPVRWVIINPNNSSGLILATELGVWTTDNVNGASTVWSPSNSGLANVRVNMINYRSSDNLLIAATHGRGLFVATLLTQPTSDFESPNVVSYVGVPIQFQNASHNAQNFNWSFGDGGSSTLENPVHAFSAPGSYSVSLAINNGAQTTLKNQFIKILPRRSTPFTISNGGDFEANNQEFGGITITGTGWERGVSDIAGKSGVSSGNNAWVTSIASNYANNTESYLLTPNFNFTSILSNYKLRFKAKWQFENFVDGFRIEYTNDSGRNWQPIVGSVTSATYNFANDDANIVASFNNGEPFFTNSSNGFEQKIFDVSSLGGNRSVAFRFVVRSNSNTTAAGVAIDDFEVDGVGNTILSNGTINLNVTTTGLNNKLTWMLSELNDIYQLELEHSEDGRSFNRIAILPKGTFSYNHQPQNHSFRDYYRLKAIFNNNQTKLSSTVSVLKNVTLLSSCYFVGTAKTIFVQASNKVRSLKVINELGQQVWANQFSGGFARINTIQWQKGVYFVVATNGSESHFQKIVVY